MEFGSFDAEYRSLATTGQLSISSSSSSETSNGNTIPGLTTPSNGNKATDKIVEEDSEWVNEPEETTAAAVAAADKA